MLSVTVVKHHLRPKNFLIKYCKNVNTSPPRVRLFHISYNQMLWSEAASSMTAVTAVLWPVIVSLSGKGAEDFVKEFLKKSLANVLKPEAGEDQVFDKEMVNALLYALAGFAQNFEDELCDAGCNSAAITSFESNVADFLRTSRVQDQLGLSFIGQVPNPDIMSAVWADLRPIAKDLPGEFSWKRVSARYHRHVAKLCERSKVLRERCLLRGVLEIASSVRAQRPHDPGWNLEGYRHSIRSLHAYLKMHQLGAEAQLRGPIPLKNIFIEQHVRQRQDLPQWFFRLPIEAREALLNETWPEKSEVLVRAIRAVFDQSLFEAIVEGAQKSEVSMDTIKGMIRDVRLKLVGGSLESAMSFTLDPSERLVVLIGDPGSGKSTLLHKLLLDWADEEGAGIQGVPLIVELRKYHEQRSSNATVVDFPSYLQNGCAQEWQLAASDVRDALVENRAILLLDGLDEVFDPIRREELFSTVGRLATEYPNLRIVITTRPFGYTPATLEGRGFRHGFLQPLDNHQVVTFLNRWHASLADDNREQLKSRLGAQIQREARLRELSGNPLLLTLMCLLNRTEPLPERRAALYERCVNLLLHQWETVVHMLPAGPRIGPYGVNNLQLSVDEKRQVLREIAFRMQSMDATLAGNIITKRELVEVLSRALPSWIDSVHRQRVGEELVEQLEARNYILASLGGQRFGFVHRTFLEFCCADWFYHRLVRLGTFSKEEFFVALFGKYRKAREWREVLLLVASQLEVPRLRDVVANMFSDIRAERPLFRANVKSDREMGRAAEEEKSDREKARAAKEEYTYQVCLAAHCMAGVANREEMLDVAEKIWAELNGLMRNGSFNHAAACVSAACAAWAGEERLHQWLVELLKDAPEPHVRAVAIEEFARHYSGDKEARELLFACSQDPDPVPRQCVLSSLVQFWPVDSDLLTWLRAICIDDSSATVRSTALKLFGTHVSPDEEALSFFKKRVQSDSMSVPREVALKEVARKWPGDPRGREVMETCLATDTEEGPRLVAMGALAKYWPRDSAVAALLMHHASVELEEGPKQRAIELLASGWSRDPEIIAFLKKMHEAEKNPTVKECLLSVIGNMLNKIM
jgi:hypothetical protein